MIKKYQDKEWLEKKHSEEKLSPGQIAKLCGVHQVTIWRWLITFNIPRRSVSEGRHLSKGNHCNLSQEAIDWISGELLGDASLHSSSNWSAGFSYASKYEEYINYISDTLKSFGIKRSGKICKRYSADSKGNYHYSYNYSSLRYAELLTFYEKWYPNGKKIIPKNLELTPLTLRQHYIGDGYLGHRKIYRPYILLCTCGFSMPDVEWLTKQLIDLGFKATRWASNNSIGISTHSVKDFLNYIGTCPVKCYQYKFDY